MKSKIKSSKYWKTFLGIELFKIKYYFQLFLYKYFSIQLPKLKDQKNYWKDRGQVYMDEILHSGYLDREIFFQNMLINFLKKTEFSSFFEAGCGFGWNIKRVKADFPNVRVGGLDFSITQLENVKSYVKPFNIPIVNGDNCHIPFKDDAFDIGFSLGVFMNIHPSKIHLAFKEMMRVCKKYIIHIEYDEDNTTKELKEKRTFKSNIISHNYKKIYTQLGAKVQLKSYKDFGEQYKNHYATLKSNLQRWEGFEGPEKYIFIVISL